jgi:hypothetical protein
MRAACAQWPRARRAEQAHPTLIEARQLAQQLQRHLLLLNDLEVGGILCQFVDVLVCACARPPQWGGSCALGAANVHIRPPCWGPPPCGPRWQPDEIDKLNRTIHVMNRARAFGRASRAFSRLLATDAAASPPLKLHPVPLHFRHVLMCTAIPAAQWSPTHTGPLEADGRPTQPTGVRTHATHRAPRVLLIHANVGAHVFANAAVASRKAGRPWLFTLFEQPPAGSETRDLYADRDLIVFPERMRLPASSLSSDEHVQQLVQPPGRARARAPLT